MSFPRQGNVWALLWAALWLGVAGAACQREPIKIGFSGTLTGPFSDLGIHGRNGARMAVEAINGTGGVLGRPLELVVMDDEGTPEGAVQADRKLAGLGVVAVIGHMTSALSMAALPRHPRETGIPAHFAHHLHTPSQRPQGSVFQGATDHGRRRPRPGPVGHGETFPKDRLHDSRYPKRRLHCALGRGFRRRICETERWPLHCLPAHLWEHRSRRYPRCDGDAPCGEAGCRAPREFGSGRRLFSSRLRLGRDPGQILSSGWAQTEAFLAESGPLAENLLFASENMPTDASARLRDFSWEYRKRFGIAPSFAAVRAYEAVQFAASALKETGGRRDRLVKALSTPRTIDGLYGPLTMDAYGDASGPYFIVGVREGRFVVLEFLSGAPS